MNVTLTELILLCWAVLATGAAVAASRKSSMLTRLIKFMLEAPEAYKELKARHDRVVAHARERA